MIKPNPGKITSGFHEPRPLSNPGDHIHGAVDIGAPVGSIIRAPESGTCFAYVGIRQQEATYWPVMPVIHDKPFHWCNYFYDMYGGILVLMAHNGDPRIVTRTYIIAHSYGNQIFNESILADFPQHWVEEKQNSRFPIHANYTDTIDVQEGDPIGFVGNAGYSTGSHIHIECHHGYKWEHHENRVNLEELWTN